MSIVLVLFLLVNSCKDWGDPWLRHVLWSQLAPDHTFPYWLLHRCIRQIACWVGHMCQGSLRGLSGALAWDIMCCSLHCSGRSSWHQQLGISHLVWKGRCSNLVSLFSNMLHGWILDNHMKVYRLPLWVALCGFWSSVFWCSILCGCLWPWFLWVSNACE